MAAKSARDHVPTPAPPIPTNPPTTRPPRTTPGQRRWGHPMAATRREGQTRRGRYHTIRTFHRRKSEVVNTLHVLVVPLRRRQR